MTNGQDPYRQAREGSCIAPTWSRLCLVTFVILLATACWGGNDSAESEAAPATTAAASFSDSAAPTTTLAMSFAEEDAAEVELLSGDGDASVESSVVAGLPATTPADLGRDVIYRGTLSIRASDVEAAVREAVNIVQGLGGIVFGQQVSSHPEPQSHLTFKVLPADFMPVLERLSGVGELLEKKITADDVTERIVDFRSRIATAEASVLRLRDLLQEAPNIENVALIERELVQRETDLETLRGRLRTLTDAVSLATIDMAILQLHDPVPDTGIDVNAWVSDSDEDPCLGSDVLIASPDDDAYFCVQVENTGEVALADVEVSSGALRLRPQDQRSFQLLAGSFDRIEPGELLSAVLHMAIREGRIAGRAATRGGIEVEFEVSGTPVPDDGVPLDTVTGGSFMWVVVEEEEGPPSFIGAVQTGYRGMVRALAYIVATIGLLLPFLPAMAVIGGFYWWFRRLVRGRRSARSIPADSGPTRPQHPPGNPSD